MKIPRSFHPLANRASAAFLLLLAPAAEAAAPTPIRSGPPVWNYFHVGVLTAPGLDTPAVSAAVGAEIVLKSPFTLSGELGAVTALRRNHGASVAGGPGPSRRTTDAALVSANLGVHFFNSPIAPFLTAGPTGFATPAGLAAGYNLCTGVHLLKTGARPLRLEYRALLFERVTAHRFGVGLVF